MATSHAIGCDAEDYRWVKEQAALKSTTRRNYLKRAIFLYQHVTTALIAMKSNESKSVTLSIDGDRCEITIRKLDPIKEVRA